MATVHDRLRTMINEDADLYPDAVLDSYLADVLLVDSEGRFPDDEEYVPTYDLAAAAAVLWREKAGALARRAFDVQTDLTRASRSQLMDNAIRMARFYEKRTVAKTFTQGVVRYEPEEVSVIGNEA